MKYILLVQHIDETDCVRKVVLNKQFLHELILTNTSKDVKKFLVSSQFYLDLFLQKCYDMDTRGTQ